MRILVVEDQGDVAEFIADSLRDLEGHEVDIAASADAAEKLAAATVYDLFLVDLYLRGPEDAPDGLAFAKSVRKAKPHARIILMTGKSYSRLLTDIIVRADLAFMLAKPIDLTTLIETVRSVLGEEDGD